MRYSLDFRQCVLAYKKMSLLLKKQVNLPPGAHVVRGRARLRHAAAAGSGTPKPRQIRSHEQEFRCIFLEQYCFLGDKLQWSRGRGDFRGGRFCPCTATELLLQLIFVVSSRRGEGSKMGRGISLIRNRLA